MGQRQNTWNICFSVEDVSILRKRDKDEMIAGRDWGDTVSGIRSPGREAQKGA
jgi:hypothetical protein